jgi:methyl-accepting chemotaxis protein
MRADVRATLEQARTATESLNQTLERYDSLADELATDGDSAVGHLARTADELSRTLEEVRRVASLAAAGDGTAGELLTNPDLYHSLTDAATRLDDVLVQMQLLIEKIRAEGLRIGG